MRVLLFAALSLVVSCTKDPAAATAPCEAVRASSLFAESGVKRIDADPTADVHGMYACTVRWWTAHGLFAQATYSWSEGGTVPRQLFDATARTMLKGADDATAHYPGALEAKEGRATAMGQPAHCTLVSFSPQRTLFACAIEQQSPNADGGSPEQAAAARIAQVFALALR